MHRRLNWSYPRQITVSFLLIIVLGAALLCLPAAAKSGEGTPFLNALFTATSATCITGLSVYDIYSHFSLFGQIVILAMIQIGGLGIMGFVALFFFLLRRKISLQQRIRMADSLSVETNRGIVKMMQRMVVITFLFEFSGAAILAIRFVPLFGWKTGIWYSVFHAVSAFCNAGFDLMGKLEPGSSLMLFADDPLVNITIMLLIVLGGLGFFVWSDLLDWKPKKRLRVHTKLVLVTTSVLLFGGALLFWILENNACFSHLSVGGKTLAAFFQSVTCRTAGFYTVSPAELSNASKLLAILLMFIGGSPGSTAGGVKTVTFVLAILAANAVIRGKNAVHLFGRKIDPKNIGQALAIIMISTAVLFSVLLLLCMTENFPFMDLLFEAVSAFATVGISTGITVSLTNIGKILIIFLMFFGRIGVLSFAIALTAKTGEGNTDYPVEKVMVG